jgi:hypothetical protein
MISRIPHVRIVVAACAAAIIGYAAFSAYVVVVLKDATMIGDTIGTWKSFAVLAFGFWLGSSSGGKAKDDAPSGKPDDPVNVVEPEGDPVPVEEK